MVIGQKYPLFAPFLRVTAPVLAETFTGDASTNHIIVTPDFKSIPQFIQKCGGVQKFKTASLATSRRPPPANFAGSKYLSMSSSTPNSNTLAQCVWKIYRGGGVQKTKIWSPRSPPSGQTFTRNHTVLTHIYPYTKFHFPSSISFWYRERVQNLIWGYYAPAARRASETLGLRVFQVLGKFKLFVKFRNYSSLYIVELCEYVFAIGWNFGYLLPSSSKALESPTIIRSKLKTSLEI